MDQVKIGKFIQALRKEKGLTQKDLADQIGVSDKTVSKWECGNGLPDMASMDALCKMLNISINELISGESLPPETYSTKAEENMIRLLKENETNKHIAKWQLVAGLVMTVVAFGLVLGSSAGFQTNILGAFLDLPSIIFLILVCGALVLLSGARTMVDILKVVQKVILPAGFLVTFIELIILLYNIADPWTIGPCLAVAMIVPLYSLFIYLIVFIILTRKEN